MCLFETFFSDHCGTQSMAVLWKRRSSCSWSIRRAGSLSLWGATVYSVTLGTFLSVLVYTSCAIKWNHTWWPLKKDFGEGSSKIERYKDGVWIPFALRLLVLDSLNNLVLHDMPNHPEPHSTWRTREEAWGQLSERVLGRLLLSS